MGLTNTVRVYDAAGQTQTKRPLVLSQVFGPGDFPAGTFPKPRVNGTGAAAWQVNVKTRWPDNSVQHALIAIRATIPPSGSADVDFVRDANPCHAGNQAACDAAALTQQQMLDFNTGGGTGSWNAQIEATLNSITHTANARTMLGAGTFSYWAKGPVLTWVIVEDRTTALSHNFGWQWNGSAWVTAPSASYKSLMPSFGLQFWPDPDGAGGLTAWPGVEAEAGLHSGMTTRIQRLPLDSLAVKTGTSLTTVYTQAPANFIARRMWHKIAWSGTAPAAEVRDYNLAHLVHSRLFPPYNLKLTPATPATDWVTTYNNNMGADADVQFCSNTGRCGNWTKGMSSPGARPDIGLIPGYFVNSLYYLANGANPVATRLEVWNKLVLGNADAGLSMPAFYMETDAARTGTRALFNSPTDATTPAFGRIISIGARPTLYTSGTFEQTYGSNASDNITLLCSADPCNGVRTASPTTTYRMDWNIEGFTQAGSHAYSPFAAPYMLTGRWMYLRAHQSWATYLLVAYGGSARKQDLGTVYENSDNRGMAWILRDLWLGYVLTPDGDPEKAYFQHKLKTNEQMLEGYYEAASGNQKPADANCTGYVYTSGRDSWCDGYVQHRYGPNPLKFQTRGSITTPITGFLWPPAAIGSSLWMTHYIAMSWGWIYHSGTVPSWGSKPYLYYPWAAMGEHLTGGTLSPDTNMWYFANYQSASARSSPNGYFQTWKDWADAHNYRTTLTSDISTATTSVVIESAAFPNPVTAIGALWVDSEWMKICSLALNSPSAGKSTATICSGGRGIWGTKPASHLAGAAVKLFQGQDPGKLKGDDYPMLAVSARAFYTEVNTQYGSGLQAYEKFNQATARNKLLDPHFVFLPPDKITAARATASAGQLALEWVAPSGEACRVYVGASGPVEASDAGDPRATVSSRRQRYTATGLSQGTYKYRITCGLAQVYGQAAVP